VPDLGHSRRFGRFHNRGIFATCREGPDEAQHEP
jgi:hypothetical protein